jgi:multisubunit Na+/H+ antiporter MnhE subunit
MPQDVRRWTVWWAILAALYLLLADTVTWPEPVLGAVAAALGATAATLVARAVPAARPPGRWAVAAIRPLVGVIADLVPLVRVLVTRGVLRRGDESVLVEVPFAATSEDPEDVARRGWTEALGSLAPNTVVVEVDKRRGVLLAHQLSPTPDAAARAAPLR